LTPCSEKAFAPPGPPMAVLVAPFAGVNVAENLMFWAEIVFGLPALGNVPTAWLGNPFAIKERAVLLHAQLQVEVSEPDVLYVPW